MSRHQRVPIGTKVYREGKYGIVVRCLKRFPAVYVIWGTQDVNQALQWEQNFVQRSQLVSLNDPSLGVESTWNA